jgi:MFS family permease
LQGALGLDLAEIAWLPTVYLITNAVTGCVLVKYRQQFGMRSFCLIFLSLHVICIVAHLFVRGLLSAVAVRAAGGIVASALTSLSVFYMIQALPREYRLRALVLGIGLPQLALPLARLFSLETLAIDSWKGPYLLELGLSLLTLAVVLTVRLPSNQRVKAFELLDLVSFSFYAAAISLFGSAVGLGSYLWWTDRAWIGYCLALSIPSLIIALTIEFHREKPLIDIRWLSGLVLIRFAVVAVLARLVLSEQAVGAIGLLRDFGLVNDDFRMLSLLIFGAAVAGIAVSTIAVGQKRLTPLVMLAVALVALGAYMDTSAGVLTRAPQLYATQMIIAFATTLFIGPSYVFGLSRVISEGGSRMTSFVALFGMAQSIGSLIGTSVIQTYLMYAQQYHLADLRGQLTTFSPKVSSDVIAFAELYSGSVSDTARRTAEGLAMLSRQISLLARVAAYDDVFFMISLIASATTALLLVVIANAFWLKSRTTGSSK